MYNSDQGTLDFHDLIRELHRVSLCAVPTSFHLYLEKLAASGQLARHYTQNIDCIEDNLHYLAPDAEPGFSDETWAKTIQLHGRLHTTVCQQCRHQDSLVPELFGGASAPLCPHCEDNETRRASEGRRPRGIGRLRPHIVLYGEANPDEDVIGQVVEADLQKPIDVVLVVGTSLKIPGMKRLVTEFSRAAKLQATSSVIWISKEAPPAHLMSIFDVILLGDCDDVIPLLEQ